MQKERFYGRLRFIELMEAHGMTHELAMSTMREIFGVAEANRMAKEYAAKGTAHAKAMSNRRDKTVLSSWRLLLKPLNAKIRALKFQGPKRPTEDERTFYELARRALEKTQGYIEVQRAKAEALTDKRLSPATVARQLKLPNAGLYWVDWVPPDVRKAVEAEEARIHAERTVGAKAPGIFRVSTDQRQIALRAQHFVTLNARIDTLRDQIKALPPATPATDPIRLVHLKAEISVYQQALLALDSWPTHRVLPVDPVAMLGTNIVGVTNAVDDARQEITSYADGPDGIDTANLERLVNEALERAQDKAAAARATLARREAGIRKVRKDKKPKDDE